MKNSIKRIPALLIVVLMIFNLAACVGNSASNSTTSSAAVTSTAMVSSTAVETKKEPVTIKIATFWVGTLPEAPFFKKLIEEFPKTALGEGVTINVEEIPGADSYAQKMKLFIASGDLPDVVQPTGANYLDIAVKSDKIADLTSYFEADKEWKGLFDPKSLEYNSRNGKNYAVPFTKEVCNLYYNKELFAKAGITEFPKTWDEFFAACEKLKAANITPIAMDTAEYGWFTSLVLSAMIGSDGEAGNKWMNTQLPKDYSTPEVIKAFTNIQKILKNYTTKDAIGGNWVIPTNHFEKGEAAMVANGPWMIPDFKDTTKVAAGFYDKVGVAAFPGDGIVMVPQFGDMIGAKDKAKIDAAVNFEKFKTSKESQIEYMKTTGNLYESPNIPIPQDIIKDNPLLGDVIDLAGKATVKFGENQAYWYPNTLDALSNLLPQLAFDKITPEAMCKKLTETAQKNK